MKKLYNAKKILIFTLLVITLILFSLQQFYIIFIPNPLKEISSQIYCEKDEDCVPDRLCHPTKVVNKEYALPQENETGCTLDCKTILDCGRAKPVCRFNQCAIRRVWNK